MEAAHLAAEREAMLLVLGDICPSADSGVRSLTCTVQAMGTRLQEVMEAVSSDDARANAGSPSEAEGDGPRGAVLANPQLLASIINFMKCGHWLYLTPVARSWRTAYMSVTAQREGAPSVCVTWGTAAVEAPERLAMALACGINVQRLTRAYFVQNAAGASGSMEVVRRLHGLGMPISDGALIGAARRTGVMNRLLALALGSGEQVTLSTWLFVGLCTFSDAYDGEQRAALIWLSQQMRPWPVWFCTVLCHTAAEKGQLAALKFLIHEDYGQALFGPLIWDLSAVNMRGPEWTAGRHYLSSFSVDGGRYRPTLMDKAAAGGCVEALQWLRQEHALPFTPVTMPCAAENGHLTALQWLYQAGCQCDVDRVCQWSLRAISPSATPLQMEWLRSLGGSWRREDGTTMLRRLMGSGGTELSSIKDMIAWLRSEDAEWPQLSEDIECHSDSSAELVVWATQQGCPWGDWTPECCALVSRGRYSIKKALHDAGCPCRCD
ncbi:hypothetical protein JKP88DRAFT_302103 [Tribonema minus]|uniref:Uncharacterized protein n=1 Tax=Tribonema minus TaxID=303371 RepID=A0A835ZI44_9STRA|nr:hypothetical protein JKP88DRAFT_302103 [Tribonema minus]